MTAGEITSFIGVTSDSPYERPLAPDVHLETHKMSIDECVDKVFERLQFASSTVLLQSTCPMVRRGEL